MKQRDLMRKLFREHGDDEATLVRLYAQGERRGAVKRVKNDAGLEPEAYARALYLDGKRKGWITEG